MLANLQAKSSTSGNGYSRESDNLPEAPLLEVDIPEDSIQKDSSDDDSVVSSHEEFYSFISKSQSNKGKQPVRRRRNSQYHIILENLFSDEEENLAKIY
ncbi:433_t:CDS:2 [Gigaspora rosea]|nr:433_t:CDS:2 [Gigaspora rosea]